MKLDEHNNPLCGNCYGVLERGKLRHRDGVAHCPDCYEPVDTKRCTRCQRDKAIVEFNRDGRCYRSECAKCQAKAAKALNGTAHGKELSRIRSRAYRARIRVLLASVRDVTGARPSRHGSPSVTSREPVRDVTGARPSRHGSPSVTSREPVRDVTDVIPPRPKAKPAPATGPKPASVPQSYRASDWDPDKDPLDWADVPFVLLRDPRFDPSESSTWPDDDDPVWQGPNARRAGWC